MKNIILLLTLTLSFAAHGNSVQQQFQGGWEGACWAGPNGESYKGFDLVEATRIRGGMAQFSDGKCENFVFSFNVYNVTVTPVYQDNDYLIVRHAHSEGDWVRFGSMHLQENRDLVFDNEYNDLTPSQQHRNFTETEEGLGGEYMIRIPLEKVNKYFSKQQ